MVQLPIKRTIERIPGGMMIVPLFTGAIIRTFAPGTPQFFGSFTGALFTVVLGDAGSVDVYVKGKLQPRGRPGQVSKFVVHG